MPLDIEQPEDLKAYLLQAGHIDVHEQVKLSVLQGGVSNKTVLVQKTSEAWVLKQALEKLRVKVDWFSDPSRIHREALGLQYLSEMIPDCIPKLIFEDFKNHILAMSAISEPHQNWKTRLLAGHLQKDHIFQFATMLAKIHQESFQRSSTLSKVFADTSFFESLRLEPYYLFTATQIPEAATFLQTLVNKTHFEKHTLVHGDYSPKNVLIHQDKLVLLDYEVIHWGDPAFDVGFAITHLLSKAHYFSSQDFLDAVSLFWQTYYKQDYGSNFELRCVQHTLGCMLARVSGRSPLEYLSELQKRRQQEITLSLLDSQTISQLIQHFKKGLLAGS